MGDIIKNNVKLEDDMIPRSCDESDKLSTKIFKVYPLVGDFSPSKKTLANWEEVTCKYVEKRLEKKSARFYDWVYDQVALTIVHYAKSWNSNEEGKFTKYAAMQLGYKDDNGKIWNLLTGKVTQIYDDSMETKMTAITEDKPCKRAYLG